MEEVCAGEVRPEDMVSHCAVLYEDPLLLQLRRALLDVRASVPLFHYESFVSALPSTSVPTGQDRFRVAVLVEGAVQYGMGRQFQAVVSQTTDAEVFYDREEALRWLLASSDPSGPALPPAR